jgi:hypothetical protein
VVTFLDDVGREYMEYSFSRRGETRLFLVKVFIWTYPNDDPGLGLGDSMKHEDIRYREDGYVKRIIIDKVEGFKDTAEYSDVPVEDNWEPVPAFGDYWSVGRKERREPFR